MRIEWERTRLAFRLLQPRERKIFSALAVFLIVGFFGTLTKINERVSYLEPALGGAWREGVVGPPLFRNPVLPIPAPARALASLFFPGLLRPAGGGEFGPALPLRAQESG